MTRPHVVDEVVARVVDHRLDAAGPVSLDEVALAIGGRAISQDEVEAVLDALEARGVTLVAAPGDGAVERMRQVLALGRSLRDALGRAPTAAEVAAAGRLPEAVVLGALRLLKSASAG